MTNLIINSYKRNLPKFEEIYKLYTEIVNLNRKHDEVMTKVIRYYNIIFKNISSTRKIVRLKGRNKAFVVTKTGLSQKDEYQINSISLTAIPKIDFFNDLVLISKPENKKEFKKVLSRQKYKIFCNFLKKAKLLEIKNSFEIANANKSVLEYKKIQTPTMIEKIILNYTTLEIYPAHFGGKIQIPLYGLSFDSMSLLEQIFPEAKRLLKTAKKNKEKEIENLLKFIEYLKVKFENQLVLEELYAKPRKDIFKD